MPSKHDEDFYGWVKEQAELLLTKNFDRLDIPALADQG